MLSSLYKLQACLLGSVLLLLGSLVMAAESGTAAEAKAMLDKAVAAIKQDETKALGMFTKGEGGFKEKDLYVFCGGPDGNFSANGAKPELVGQQSLKNLKDKTGKPIGEEMYKSAAEGQIKEIDYLWPRPGGTEPVAKSTYYTKVKDQLCGVGYYK